MTGRMVQLINAVSDCHKVCATLYSPLLFMGRTRTATFTLETLRLLSSMVPPDLWQMNEWTQAKPVTLCAHFNQKVAFVDIYVIHYKPHFPELHLNTSFYFYTATSSRETQVSVNTHSHTHTRLHVACKLP